MKRVFLASLLATFALPCFAQDDEGDRTPPGPEAEAEAGEDEEPLLRWGRPSTGGLSGFGEVIGVDPLPEMKFRAGLSISHQEIHVADKIISGVEFESEAQAQVYRLEFGAAFMKMIEASLALPLIDIDQGSNFGFRDQDLGNGNPELSVKFLAPLGSETISLAAYSRIHFSWGERDIFKPKKVLTEGDRAEWELGTAVGLHFGPATIVTNLAFRLLEGGIQTFRYRFGVALDPMDMLSVTLYWTGEEIEGKTRNYGALGMTVHAFVADMVVIGLGAEYLVVDDAIDDILTGIPGSTSESGDEVELWSVTFDVSILF